MIRILKNGLVFILKLISIYIITLILPLLFILNSKDYTYIAEAQQTAFSVFIIMSTMLTVIFSFIFFMKFEFIFLKNSIGFSITRKSFYIAVQILKIISSITLTIIYLIFINIIGLKFTSIEIAKNFINISFLFVLIFIFMATLGEFCGIIINTMNKFIMFLVLFYLIIACGVPILVSKLIDIKSLNNIYLYIISSTFLIVSFIFCIFNWFIIRRYPLK